MALKNNLKQIRMTEFMMSATEFAKYLEVDLKSYSNWERDISRPKLELAIITAKKLNRTVESIWYIE